MKPIGKIISPNIQVAWMNIHFEKLCPRQLNYPTTRAPKQLIWNCITIIQWK